MCVVTIEGALAFQYKTFYPSYCSLVKEKIEGKVAVLNKDMNCFFKTAASVYSSLFYKPVDKIYISTTHPKNIFDIPFILY